ncbi:AAA family ATPase [Candidatus Methylospira mobilis]|uniref:AAA family ATPase n=1 Tax=Candidatus Methylospira mobilis TaxID=1808979 RepID=A0A5Q0BIL1_9GAMM|nr:serine/threonine-protein kinase [Candidatus Methylospira mobilis]QFY41666.1 AAA family ATPase [Candidatus Methylospira mobilis]
MTNYQAMDDAPDYLHRGRRYDVVRLRDPSTPRMLVSKRLADGAEQEYAGALAGLRNEARILERLQGLPGCTQWVDFDASAKSLIVEDFEGVALEDSGLLGRVDLDQFLTLAAQLATVLAAIHGRGVIHKDINPANILVRTETLQLQIIDFDLATTIAEEHRGFDSLNHMLGTLAYLSPEQSGRMNRPVDYRTDLYALGASFYALATGSPPFRENDPAALIHAHLSRVPVPPRQGAPWLPASLEKLILTLLSKEPDHRYQSAAGLVHDLAVMQECVKRKKFLDDIPLKRGDAPLTLRPPRRLYGRDHELNRLIRALSDAIAGPSQALFVAGYSGIGKTSFIQEVYRPLTLHAGLFIGGKFNQLQRERPFSAPAQALRQLCHFWMAEDEHVLLRRRSQLVEGMENEISALFEVLPELSVLLGPQPTAPELGPIDSQARLRSLLVELIHRAASPGHPLVLFLDDLQWADQPSMDLIAALLQASNPGGLLFIGAYRDNEIDATHTLTHVLKLPTATGIPVPILALSSLSCDDTAQMIGDMLCMQTDTVSSLAAAVHRKTAGNPYFTFEFLKSLCRDGSLERNLNEEGWRWDLDKITASLSSENVVDFLTAKLVELDPAKQEVLSIAACLGNDLTLGGLELGAAIPVDELIELIRPALELGLLVTSSAMLFHQASRETKLRFCHDRMQQAAYQLQSEEQRALIHLLIARRYAAMNGESDNPFVAAEHYAHAVPLLADESERAQVSDLFLRAAIRARRAGSFAVAERFLRLGCSLLPVESWRAAPDAAYQLHAELHLALHCQARAAEADVVYRQLSDHAARPLQLIRPACLQLASLTTRTLFADAIALGCDLLRRLDQPVPLADLAASTERELDIFYRHVDNGALERLADSPELTDEYLLGVAIMMNRFLSMAFFIKPEIAYWLIMRLARLWLEHGYSPAMINCMVFSIVPTVALRGDYAAGGLAGRMAMNIGITRENGLETARARLLFCVFNFHWFESLEEGVANARLAFSELVRVAGLMEYAAFICYSLYVALVTQIETASLPQVREELVKATQFSDRMGNVLFEQILRTLRQWACALEGTTGDSGGFSSGEFDEETHFRQLAANPVALIHYHVYRAMTACLFRDSEALHRHVDAALGLASYIVTFYLSAVLSFLHSLSLIERLKCNDPQSKTHEPAISASANPD